MDEQKLYQSDYTLDAPLIKRINLAKEMESFEGVPKEPVSASELIRQRRDILARNGENQRKRERVSQYEYLVNTKTEEVARLQKQLQIKQAELQQAQADLQIAKTSCIRSA